MNKERIRELETAYSEAVRLQAISATERNSALKERDALKTRIAELKDELQDWWEVSSTAEKTLIAERKLAREGKGER